MSNNDNLKQYNGEPSEAATASSTNLHTASQPSNASGSTTKPDQVASRQKSLQKIKQKKQAVLALPYNEKLLKLAVYSKCQVRH